MPIGNNILAGASGQGDTGYDIEQSLRFDDGDSAQLTRTPSAEGNRKTWTWSGWVKRGNMGATQMFFSGNAVTDLYFSSGDILGMQDTTANLRTTAVYRDSGAWYHIVFAVDTTQSVAANRVKVYVNGEQVTDFGTETYPSLNEETDVNATSAQYIGSRNSDYWDGYLAEVHFIDGQALTPASFGETDSATNQWVPIEYDGSYGTNGFYQKYSATELANSFTDSSSSSHTITANGDVTHSRAQKKIGSSSIKFDGSGDYLSLADSGDWDFSGQFTVEGWFRWSSFHSSVTSDLIGSANNAAYLGSSKSGWVLGYLEDSPGPRLTWSYQSNNSWVTNLTFSTDLSLDTWYHIAVSRDGSNDVRMFVDGTQVGSTQSDSTSIVTTEGLWVGGGYNSTARLLDGYMDEIRISDTARYTTTFTPLTTAFVADSNTKLLIHSDFDGGLGADSSGNTNDFTPTNLVATDQMIDTPTNNFCTLNPVLGGAAELAEGNLLFDPTTSPDATKSSSGTIGATTGKWYYEFYIHDVTNNGPIGARNDVGLWDETGGPPGYCEYAAESGGAIYLDGLSTISSVGSYVATDIIGVAVNMDDGKIQWFKNGAVLSGSGNVPVTMPATTAAGFVPYVRGYSPDKYCANFGQDSSFAGTVTAQGNQDGNGIGDFAYPVPSGYLALCTDNLPDPSIADPTAHFNTKLYTGDGATTLAVSGVGFQPDFTWIKNRDQADDHTLVDSVRGATNYLVSNETDAEVDDSTFVASLDSDGFTVGDDVVVNTSTENYASWNWKAGGTAVSNTDGTITGGSSVSANTTAGFSIVGYTGDDSSSATVGHGLSQAPEMIILKKRSGTAQWPVGSEGGGIDWNDYLALDKSNNSGNYPYWNDTAPTSSVFSIGTDDDVNELDGTYIAYCFHSVDGYSKVGSYTGNGTDGDGNFLYCGFRPSYVLFKEISAVNGWAIIDNKTNPYNLADQVLIANSSGATYSHSSGVDFLSNGIKLINNNGMWNDSGQTYIYLAIAESPFKTSNAR